MKVPEFFAALLLWQSALLVNIGAVAVPDHLRYERAVHLPAGAGGLSCITLDAEVLAHTASPAHNDLRLFGGYPGRPVQGEVPYLFTESGPEPVAPAEATAEHLVRSGDGFRFDLRMPPRAYSEVHLQLRERDFVGTAVVSGEGPHGRRESLGSFGIFDLSAERLGRWTVLPMEETTAPVLHILLTLRTPAGVPMRNLPPGIVIGAAVPPSRERQTVYTPVAVTDVLQQQPEASVALLHVPAHVPVEQVQFTFSPDLDANFARQVLVKARADADPLADTELIEAGRIEHVSLPSGDPHLNSIEVKENGVSATLGATLGSSATVRVFVENQGLPPLPIRAVTLAMRQRRMCFLANSALAYTLRYGDPALPAPMYDDAPLQAVPAAPVQGTLGPQEVNPNWRPRTDGRSYFDRHPEFFWVMVLLCAGMMAGTALQFVQHREA